MLTFRSSLPDIFCKRGFLKNFTKLSGKDLQRNLFILKLQACNFITKKTPVQVLYGKLHDYGYYESKKLEIEN